VGDAFPGALLALEMGLDLLRIDQTTQIGVGESNSGKAESNFDLGR
jgi:hypothetical protein